jgi:ParB/RepB/Spo0J family partition protein
LTARAGGRPAGIAAAVLAPPPGSLGPLEARGQGAAPLAALAVPVGQLVPDPERPRRRFSEERLACLAASVRACGVIHALLVVPHPDLGARAATPFQILVGERRWLAARRAGLATVPAVVREEALAPADRLMLQIAESDGEHREELALFDLATAVARAFALARCTQVQFAQRHRRSQAWLCNLLRLAQAGGLAREALEEGLLQGVLAALTYLRLTIGQQRHLLAEAREARLPIGLRRAEKAAAETEDRRRLRRGRADFGAGGGDGASGGNGAAGGDGAKGGDGADGASGTAGASGADGAEVADGGSGADSGEDLGGGGAAVANGPWGRAAAGSPAGGLAAGGSDGAGRPAAAMPAVPGAEPADFAAARYRSAVARSAGAGPGSAVAASRICVETGPRAAGPFGAAAAASSRPGGPWITLELTVAQLETLLILLGQEPAGSPREMAEQLLACL